MKEFFKVFLIGLVGSLIILAASVPLMLFINLISNNAVLSTISVITVTLIAVYAIGFFIKEFKEFREM